MATPAVSEPHSGCPPMQRSCSRALRERISGPLVLPTSLITACGGDAASAAFDMLGDEPHRRADEDEIGAGHALRQAVAGARDGAALERQVERGPRLAVAPHLDDPGAFAGGQPERATHEADADESDDGAAGGRAHRIR